MNKKGTITNRLLYNKHNAATQLTNGHGYVTPLRRDTYHTRDAQQVMQHVYYLGPVLLNKNNILCAAGFKCPAFMNVDSRFPAR
jgi:hypothetical protein